ncbi:MAG TPA: glycosyltransferase family 4 protein [Kiritimatiellia bacterium]|nr:glycosyltransferase family 4 protein [Kiritimatiellia bacterium]
MAYETLCYLFHHPSLSARSGMAPLATEMGARTLYYDVVWERLQRRSWRLGQAVRKCGQQWSGSEWFAPLPWFDEMRLVRALPRDRPSIAHYVFADFTPPVQIDLIHRRGARIVATFHVSSRRAPTVLGRVRRLSDLDAVTLVSESQREWFLERGVSPECLHVFLHGVVSGYFRPPTSRAPGKVLRMLIVGKTERDHAFAAQVLSRLPHGVAELRVMTAPDQRRNYDGARNVTLLPRLDDAGLLSEYQQADLLFMPMLDCTANNAVLESMACGTPVMVNRIGGVPEYVDPGCNIVMPDKNADAWIDRLRALAAERDVLERMRPAVRAWAEQFDWARMAEPYRRLFDELVVA